jgi:hypothetical protein
MWALRAAHLGNPRSAIESLLVRAVRRKARKTEPRTSAQSKELEGATLRVPAQHLSALLAPALAHPVRLRVKAVLVCALLIAGFGAGDLMTSFFEEQLFTDEVVHAQSSPYQRIVVTRSQRGFSLFLNGNLIADYTEPEGKTGALEVIDKGTFALQAHDPFAAGLERCDEGRRGVAFGRHRGGVILHELGQLTHAGAQRDEFDFHKFNGFAKFLSEGLDVCNFNAQMRTKYGTHGALLYSCLTHFQ